MARDAKAAARILKVQRQLRRMEEARLGEAQARVEDLNAEQLSLVATMNDDGALQHLFLDAMARRLKALVAPTRRAEADVVAQTLVVRDGAIKEKAAERLTQDRSAEEQARAARRDLAEVLELVVQRSGNASLR